MAESTRQPHPTHLDPSELGTKEYWDKYYENDLGYGDGADDEPTADGDDDDPNDDVDTQPPDPSELESWFDDVGAPAKTLAFLTSATFPLSPAFPGGDNNNDEAHATVLDLGTGNGSALFALRLEGRYRGRMVGVDYSRPSVELARRLRAQYDTVSAGSSSAMDGLSFEVLDIIRDDPVVQPWWPASPAPSGGGAGAGFDLVLDKGTFDAISLSSATVSEEASSSPSSPSSSMCSTRERRICELYPGKVLDLVKPGGFLLVTSCNWTEDEVISWFTIGLQGSRAADARFEVYDTIKYPVFEFGGQKGQGVASVCFRKVATR